MGASASTSRVLFRTAQRLRSRHGTRGWGWYHRTLAEREIKPLGPHALHYKALSAEHVRPQVYFDIESADKTYGRMVFELADDIVPKTVENFVKLCTGTGDNGYTLKGTALHLLAKDRFLAGGRVLDVNKHTGHASGASMYFEDENFILGHGERGGGPQQLSLLRDPLAAAAARRSQRVVRSHGGGPVPAGRYRGERFHSEGMSLP